MKFLEECTKAFTSKSLDVECSDVRAGSILVTVRGSVADLAAAVKDVRDNGLELPSFDALTAMPGMCVPHRGELLSFTEHTFMLARYPNHLPCTRREYTHRHEYTTPAAASASTAWCLLARRYQ